MKGVLAGNVYCHTPAEQNRLLIEVVGPFATGALAAGRLDFFLYDRFDARGPHIYLLLAGGSAEASRELAEELEGKIADFLLDLPASPGPSAEEVQKWHESCRGKALCEVDRLPGFAARNSQAWAPHPDDGYPFWIWSDLARAGDFFRAITAQSAGAIGQLAVHRGGAAVGPGLRFAASLDHALGRLGLSAAGYWGYHLATLLPERTGAIAAEPEATAELFAPLVSAGNRATFDRFFAAVAEPGRVDPQAARIAEALAAELAGERGYRALREVVHLALKQLGMNVGLQIPLVVYAWSRYHRPPPAPSAQ